MATIKKIQWTEALPPDEDCRYDHVVGTTPLGPILITWKSWKPHDDYCVDESPWIELIFMVSSNLDELKSQCQEAFERFVNSCFE